VNDNKTRRNFTAELKTAFTRAAFQQWRLSGIKAKSPDKIPEEAESTFQPSTTIAAKLNVSKVPKTNTYLTPNKNTIFTKELKTKFTRAAFQQ
jgi:hypothetical protein